MDRPEPDLSLCTVLPANAQLGLFDLFLQTLAAHAEPVAFEVVAVHGGPGPALAPLAQRHERLRLLEARGRGGSSVGLKNQAMRQACGRYLALVDYDVHFQADALAGLVHHLDETPEVGLAGPTVLDAYGEIEPTGREMPTWGSLLRRQACGLAPAGEPAWIGGGLVVIRREAFEEAGGLDEGCRPPFDEMEYSLRLAGLGWHLSVLSEARVVHARPERYHPELTPTWPLPAILGHTGRLLWKKWRHRLRRPSPVAG